MLLFMMSTLESPAEKDRFAHLYEKNRQLLLCIAKQILHSEEMAEDAVSMTFISAIENKSKVFSMDDENFRNWSVTVVRRKCFDILRKSKREDCFPSIELENLANRTAEEEPLDFLAERQEAYDLMIRCMAKLEEEDRELLVMKYVLSMSLKEIGKNMGLSDMQIGGKLSRIRARIRKIMESEAKSNE
ncbi:hypothetical protein FACS1894111_00040 [Clostridia bacterium]|nr:hypothetical protein FACS1894111_00040 [Clostridia bacterium]